MPPLPSFPDLNVSPQPRGGRAVPGDLQGLRAEAGRSPDGEAGAGLCFPGEAPSPPCLGLPPAPSGVLSCSPDLKSHLPLPPRNPTLSFQSLLPQQQLAGSS